MAGFGNSPRSTRRVLESGAAAHQMQRQKGAPPRAVEGGAFLRLPSKMRLVQSVITIRRAGLDDIPLLAEMRVRSSVERRSYVGPADVENFHRNSLRGFAAALEGGLLHSWIAFDGDRPVGTASLMFLPSLPRFGVDVERDGRIRNVYVAPEYRRRGIALALMRVVLEEASHANVDRLTLGTSDQGRALYERLGFVQKEDELIYQPRSTMPIPRDRSAG